MRMQRRMLRNQMRMFIAKIVIMFVLTIVAVAYPTSQLSDYALLILMVMGTICLAECTEDLGDTSGSKG